MRFLEPEQRAEEGREKQALHWSGRPEASPKTQSVLSTTAPYKSTVAASFAWRVFGYAHHAATAPMRETRSESKGAVLKGPRAPCLFPQAGFQLALPPTLRYAIMLPGRKSGFRAGFRPDSNRESLKFGPSAGLPQLEPRRNPAENLISGPEALLRDIGFDLMWF